MEKEKSKIIKYNKIEVNTMIENRYDYVVKHEKNNEIDKYLNLCIFENMYMEKNVVIQYCFDIDTNESIILYPDNKNIELNIICERQSNTKYNKFIFFDKINKIDKNTENEIVKIMILLCIQNIKNKYKEKNIELLSFIKINEEYIMYFLKTESYNILFISENDDDEDKINLVIKKIVIKNGNIYHEKIYDIIENENLN